MSGSTYNQSHPEVDILINGDHYKNYNDIAEAIYFFYTALYLAELDKVTIICNMVEEHSNGYCDYDEENREIELEIGLIQPYEKFLKYIAHEMIHAKQYLLGELTDSGSQKNSSNPIIKFLEKNVYRLSPHERDAWGNEDELLKRYLDYKNHK
jgi:hypothetical protein